MALLKVNHLTGLGQPATSVKEGAAQLDRARASSEIVELFLMEIGREGLETVGEEFDSSESKAAAENRFDRSGA